jgi:thymidylate synthase ThyX
MKVKLIDYQTNALEILLYTKNTRLTSGESIHDIMNWPEEKKLEHLDYMRNTISSSWEFADYTFEISEVSRSFTHQLVRTRTASFAQQAQRVVDVRDSGYVAQTDHPIFHDAVKHSFEEYGKLVDDGVPVQEARGVLPTCTNTNIIFKANLRTLSHMAEMRMCKRAEGEYQKVFAEIRREVLKVHPWAEKFIQVYCVKTGLCAFPNYAECPVKPFVLAPTKEQIAAIESAWNDCYHVANPVAKDGRTM